jgi:uncharacterized protein (TIGR02001 family)
MFNASHGVTRMTANKLSLALALALFALPMAAYAQDEAADEGDTGAMAEEESNFSWNLAVTSDYVFRGISQTDRKPALQGGLDYSFGDSGFYAGVWGSNVDFGEGTPDIELDTYVGWNADVGESTNLDIQLVRYNYFGEDEDTFGHIDYNEVIGAVTWKEMITLTGAYTNDYANSDESSWYVGLGGEWEVADSFTFSASVGRTEFEDSDGYSDWSLGVSRQFGPVNAALNYYDTNVDFDGERLSDAVVLTLSIEG